MVLGTVKLQGKFISSHRRYMVCIIRNKLTQLFICEQECAKIFHINPYIKYEGNSIKQYLIHVLAYETTPVKWSWTVHEWFLNSSCAVHEHLFMNSSWTIHEHEMAKFMKLVRFMNLGVHKFEFMNLWVHELFMNYSSWIVHELLVHDLFMNNFLKWYMNSSGIVHEHLFMNSSWIVHE